MADATESTPIDLIRRAQDGDLDAFEAVYRRNVQRVYALCPRMTADDPRAEELTQDVFVRAWEKIGLFRGDSRFSTWLHRVTVNIVLQDRRKRGRRNEREHTTDDLEVYGAAVTAAMPGTRVDLERAIAAQVPDAPQRFERGDRTTFQMGEGDAVIEAETFGGRITLRTGSLEAAAEDVR